MEPVEYQIPVSEFVAEHMALASEIIDAMMSTEKPLAPGVG